MIRIPREGVDMYHDILIAGFGGQGVLFMGNLLAYAGMEEGHYVTFMPAYGVEMRGGTANCNVIISSEEVGSPIPDSPMSGLMMNEASMMRFMESIHSGGHLFFNSSLVPQEKADRADVQRVAVPANDLAKQAGSDQMASLVMLATFVEWTRILPTESLASAMESMLSPKAREKFLERNLAALEAGVRYVRRLRDHAHQDGNG